MKVDIYSDAKYVEANDTSRAMFGHSHSIIGYLVITKGVSTVKDAPDAVNVPISKVQKEALLYQLTKNEK